MVAKYLLWVFVIAGFIMSIVNHGDVSTWNRIVVLTSLSVLAVCESIEKVGK
jgi:hypothetical protein